MIDLGPLCEFSFRFHYEEKRREFVKKRQSKVNEVSPNIEQLHEEFERLVNNHIVNKGSLATLSY